MQKNVSVKLLLVGFITVSSVLHASTSAENDLIEAARRAHHKHDIRRVIQECKDAWAVVGYFHKGVRLNAEVRQALTECWNNSYSSSLSQYRIRITQSDLERIFEKALQSVNASLSYYDKQSALSRVRSEGYMVIAQQHKTDASYAIDSAHRLIMTHLAPYISADFEKEVQAGTERVFKDGIRFLIYTILMKQVNGFNERHVDFVNKRVLFFLDTMGTQFPYVSSYAYEQWIFSLLRELMF